MSTTGVYIARSLDGTALYVGASTDVRRRLDEHRRTKAWWSQVEDVEVIETETRIEALAEERRLIASLSPVYNVRQNLTSDVREKRTPPYVGLAALRNVLGLRQSDLAERLTELTGEPYSVGALSAIENGHRGASADTLAALEVALGLRPGDLSVAYATSHSRRKADTA